MYGISRDCHESRTLLNLPPSISSSFIKRNYDALTWLRYAMCYNPPITGFRFRAIRPDEQPPSSLRCVVQCIDVKANKASCQLCRRHKVSQSSLFSSVSSYKGCHPVRQCQGCAPQNRETHKERERENDADWVTYTSGPLADKRDRERERVRTHLSTCPACAKTAEQSGNLDRQKEKEKIKMSWKFQFDKFGELILFN